MSDPLLAVLGVDPEPLVATLRERGQTVATAESLTAGLVCGALTCVPGSSAVVRGGLIVYATDLKHELAGVDRELLAARGAVHPEVALQLAVGARLKCGATWGLGLTGVAGPDAQDGVAPGTVHIAVSRDGRDGVGDVRTITVTGSRYQVRAAAVSSAFALLADHLAGPEG